MSIACSFGKNHGQFKAELKQLITDNPEDNVEELSKKIFENVAKELNSITDAHLISNEARGILSLMKNVNPESLFTNNDVPTFDLSIPKETRDKIKLNNAIPGKWFGKINKLLKSKNRSIEYYTSLVNSLYDLGNALTDDNVDGTTSFNTVFNFFAESSEKKEFYKYLTENSPELNAYEVLEKGFNEYKNSTNTKFSNTLGLIKQLSNFIYQNGDIQKSNLLISGINNMTNAKILSSIVLKEDSKGKTNFDYSSFFPYIYKDKSFKIGIVSEDSKQRSLSSEESQVAVNYLNAKVVEQAEKENSNFALFFENGNLVNKMTNNIKNAQLIDDINNPKLNAQTKYVLNFINNNWNNTLDYFFENNKLLSTIKYEQESDGSLKELDSDENSDMLNSQNVKNSDDLLNKSEFNANVVDSRLSNQDPFEKAFKPIIKYMLSTLFKTTTENGVVKSKINKVGLQEFHSFEDVKSGLIKMTIGSYNPSSMFEKFNDEKFQKLYPWVIQLKKRLGFTTMDEERTISDSKLVDLQTRLWQVFAKYKQDILLSYVTRDKKTGEFNFYNQIIDAESEGILTTWSKKLADDEENPYFKYDPTNVVKGKFFDVVKYANDIEEFAREVDPIKTLTYQGIYLTENALPELLESYRKDEIRWEYSFWSKLAAKYRDLEKNIEDSSLPLNVRNDAVRDLTNLQYALQNPIDLLRKGYDDIEAESSTIDRYISIQKPTYTEAFTTTVKNAENNSEDSIHNMSFFGRIHTVLNRINHISELRDTPYYEILHPNGNLAMSNSKWFNKLFTPEGFRTDVKFDLLNYNGVIGKTTNHVLDVGYKNFSLDETTKFLRDVQSMLQSGFEEIPRLGDKVTSIAVKMDGKLYTDPNKPIFGSENLMNIYGNYLKYEIERAKFALSNSEDTSLNKRGTKLEIFRDVLNKDLWNKLNEELKTKDAETLIKENKDKLLKDFERFSQVSVDKMFEKYLSDKDDLLSFSGSVVDKHLKNKEDQQQVFKGTGEEQFINKVKYGLKVYQLNQFAAKFEATMFFFGDPIWYKFWADDFFKRTSLFNASGEIFRSDKEMLNILNSYNQKDSYIKLLANTDDVYNINMHKYTKFDGYLRYVEFEDNDIKSISYDNIENDLKDEYGVELNAYAKMTEGDGQGWLTIDAYRMLKKAQGLWSNEINDIYLKVIRGEELTPDENAIIFVPIKLQISGPQRGTGFYKPVGHKFSVTPLIPSAIKGTHLEQIHNKLLRTGVHYALCVSGSKSAKIKSESFYENYYDPESENYSETAYTKDMYKNYGEIHIDFAKDQLSIPMHHHEDVIFATQFRKNITDVFVSEGSIVGENEDSEYIKYLYDNYAKSIDELYYEKRNKLYKELKIKEKIVNGETLLYVDDFLPLAKRLQREFANRDLPNSIISSLDINEDGTLKSSWDVNQQSQKIDQTIMSIINNSLIRQKVNGEPMVQVSTMGWEKFGLRKKGNYDIDFSKMSKSERLEWVKKHGSNDLPYYIKEGRITLNGRKVTSASKCKTSFSYKFAPLLKVLSLDGGYVESVNNLNELIKDELWLNVNDELIDRAKKMNGNLRENIQKLYNEEVEKAKGTTQEELPNCHRQMITLTGVRIPVQGPNSMEFMEVYEFLDPSAGNIIIMPSEIVAKSGSDFDIDKLSLFFPSFDKVKTDETIIAKYKQNVIKALQNSDLNVNGKELNNILLKNRNGEVLTSSEEIILEKFKKLEREQARIFPTTLSTTSENGAQNKVIDAMVALLRNTNIYNRLITPNSTGIVKPYADAKTVENNKDSLYYDPRETINGERTNEIPATSIFSEITNVQKLVDNQSGKKDLSIFASLNAFRSLAKGANLISNSSYKIGNTEVPINMWLPHNTTTNENNEEVISFAKDKTVLLGNEISPTGEERKPVLIGENFSQFMNGTVDVAKDAWISKLNLTPKASGVVAYGLMSGIDIHYLDKLLDNPLVSKYIKGLEKINSPYVILRNQKLQEFDRKLDLQKKLLGVHSRVTIKKLQQIIKKEVKTQKDFIDILENKKDSIIPLAHFIELEKQSSQLTNLTQNSNFDTSRPENIASGLVKNDTIIKIIEADGFFNKNFVKRLLNHSIVSKFNTSELTQAIGDRILPLRSLIAKILIQNINKIKAPGVNLTKTYNTFVNEMFLKMMQQKVDTLDEWNGKYYSEEIPELQGPAFLGWYDANNPESIANEYRELISKYPGLKTYDIFNKFIEYRYKNSRIKIPTLRNGAISTLSLENISKEFELLSSPYYDILGNIEKSAFYKSSNDLLSETQMNELNNLFEQKLSIDDFIKNNIDSEIYKNEKLKIDLAEYYKKHNVNFTIYPESLKVHEYYKNLNEDSIKDMLTLLEDNNIITYSENVNRETVINLLKSYEDINEKGSKIVLFKRTKGLDINKLYITSDAQNPSVMFSINNDNTFMRKQLSYGNITLDSENININNRIDSSIKEYENFKNVIENLSKVYVSSDYVNKELENEKIRNWVTKFMMSTLLQAGLRISPTYFTSAISQDFISNFITDVDVENNIEELLRNGNELIDKMFDMHPEIRKESDLSYLLTNKERNILPSVRIFSEWSKEYKDIISNREEIKKETEKRNKIIGYLSEISKNPDMSAKVKGKRLSKLFSLDVSNLKLTQNQTRILESLKEELLELPDTEIMDMLDLSHDNMEEKLEVIQTSLKAGIPLNIEQLKNIC